jgi:hypothetical protein
VSGRTKDEAQAMLDGKNTPRPGEVWEHYKGGLYSIVCTSVKEDTLVNLVTYHSNAKGTNWTRTKENFLEYVEWPDGRMRTRFVRLER